MDSDRGSCGIVLVSRFSVLFHSIWPWRAVLRNLNCLLLSRSAVELPDHPPFFFGPQVHFHYHGIPQQVPSKQPRPEGEHAVSIPLSWPRVLLATRVCMHARARVRKQLVAMREWNWSERVLYYGLFQTLIGRIEGHFSLKVMSGHLTGVLPLLSVVGCAPVCHSLPVCCFHCHLLSAWSHRGLLSGHWHIPSCPVWHNNYIKGFYQKHTPYTHTHTHTTHTHTCTHTLNGPSMLSLNMYMSTLVYTGTHSN